MKRTLMIGYILLIIVAVLQIFASFGQIIADQESIFEGDTGVSWAALEQTYPTVAAQYSAANQGALVGNLAIGLLALAIIHFAFRKSQKWSWFVLWIPPLTMIPGVITLARSDAPLWIPSLGIGMISLAFIGLLVSVRSFFQ